MTAVQCWPTIDPGSVIALDHVGIAVADLDEAKEWYLRHLGLRTVHEEVNEEQGVREAMLAASADVDSEHPGAYVQLLAPLTPESAIGRFLARSGPGIQQLAYRVRNLDGLTDRLRAEGIRLLYDDARRGTAGSRVNFIHPKDAGGVLVELVEPAKREPSTGTGPWQDDGATAEVATASQES